MRFESEFDEPSRESFSSARIGWRRKKTGFEEEDDDVVEDGIEEVTDTVVKAPGLTATGASLDSTASESKDELPLTPPPSLLALRLTGLTGLNQTELVLSPWEL